MSIFSQVTIGINNTDFKDSGLTIPKLLNRNFSKYSPANCNNTYFSNKHIKWDTSSEEVKEVLYFLSQLTSYALVRVGEHHEDIEEEGKVEAYGLELNISIDIYPPMV